MSLQRTSGSHRDPRRSDLIPRRRRSLGARAKALLGIGTAVGIVAAASVATMVVAAPQYVALCGTVEHCASTRVQTDGSPSMDTTVAVLPIDASSQTVTLQNSNAVGTTIVSILGYFDTAVPGTAKSSFRQAVADVDLEYDLGASETKTIVLPGVPEDARSVLIELGGKDLVALGRTGSADNANSCADECSTATVALTTATAPLSPSKLREALQRLADTTSTPSPYIGETVDEIVDAIGGGASSDSTSSPSATAESAPPTTEAAAESAAPTEAAAEPAPAPAEEPTTAPEAPAPAAPAPTTPTVASIGIRPDGATTGVPAGVALNTTFGDITVTQAGTVIDGQDIHGKVTVKAANVTIKNSIIRGLDSGTQYGLIDALAGAANLTVQDTEIVASVPNFYVNGIMGYNFTLNRVNIHGVVDQVHLTGGNVTVVDSWLHGNLHWDVDPTHSDGTHDDNIQIQKGTGITITNTVFADSHNASIQITQDQGKVGDVTIQNSTFNGGGCSINIAEKSNGALSGISILNNSFGRDTKWKNCAVVIASDGTKPVMTGNSYVDGLLLSIIYR